MGGKRKNYGEEEKGLYEAAEDTEEEREEITGEIQEEEEKAGKEGADLREKRKADFRMNLVTSLGAALFVLFLILFFSLVTYKGKDPNNQMGALETQEEDSEETEMKTVLLTGPDEERKEQIPETAAVMTEAASTEAGSLPEEWQEKIFGPKQASLFSSIRVSGLNNAMKEKTGYRESDFLNVLSAFLQDNNLSGITEVTFEEEIPCSAPDAVAYRAGLKGREDKTLTVILYPDYPGRYLLTLQEKQEVTVEVKTQPTPESENFQQAQTQETYQADTAAEEQTPIYDATTLSVNEIPATLLNYLGNRYELQYTLYDYLYRQGHFSVTWAEVTGYEIDADAKTVRISFLLSDSDVLTCVYDRTNNSYSYH